jgi:hypothetical protein
VHCADTKYCLLIYCIADRIADHPQELALDAFELTESKANKKRVFRQTARTFLSLIIGLRKTILQDTAVLILQGRTHALFGLPVFKCDAFIAYREAMRTHLEKFQGTDSMDADWNQLVPGLREKINKTQCAIDGGFSQVNTKMKSFVTKEYMNQLVAALGSNILESVPVNNAANNRGDAGPPPSVQEDCSPNLKTYRVPGKFASVMAMNHEWVTFVHHFQTGGVLARKHWSESERKRYSRIKIVMDLTLHFQAKHNSVPLATILEHMDCVFKTKCNGAISTFISWSSNNEIQIPSPPATSPPAASRATTQIAEV